MKRLTFILMMAIATGLFAADTYEVYIFIPKIAQTSSANIAAYNTRVALVKAELQNANKGFGDIQITNSKGTWLGMVTVDTTKINLARIKTVVSKYSVATATCGSIQRTVNKLMTAIQAEP